MTAPLTPPAETAATSAGEKAREAARMLEAYFLRRVMAEVRKSGEGGLLSPGFGGEVFREMLDEALADRMAEGGGVGLAAMVEKQLGGESPELAAATRPGTLAAVRRIYGGGADAWRPPIGAPASTADLGPGPLWQMPVETTRISSGFGKLRVDPIDPTLTRTHKGIDMIAPLGTPVHAARGGQVVRAGATTGGFGNLVVIDHGAGIRSFYGHLQSIDVRKGDQVETGAPIGAVGSTGRSSAPHLHFEVRQHGRSIDPSSDLEGLKIGSSRTNR
jgi:murein DD-endopeptidase MepM/ murein hydrolase activator NlpD